VQKKHHPEIPVVFGDIGFLLPRRADPLSQGISVIRGDSAEEPLRRLMAALEEKRSFEEIPNLTWKDEKENVHVNPLTHVLLDLNEYSITIPIYFVPW